MLTYLVLDQVADDFEEYVETVNDLNEIGWNVRLEEIYDLAFLAIRRANNNQRELATMAQTFLEEGLLYSAGTRNVRDLIVCAMQGIFHSIHSDMKTEIANLKLHKQIVTVVHCSENEIRLRYTQ